MILSFVCHKEQKVYGKNRAAGPAVSVDTRVVHLPQDVSQTQGEQRKYVKDPVGTLPSPAERKQYVAYLHILLALWIRESLLDGMV